MINSSLIQELQQAGASQAEAKELAGLASQMAELRGREPRVAGQPRTITAGWRGWWMPVGIGAAGLLMGALVVTVAQISLPGSLLYPAKRVSEVVAVIVYPNYRGVVMMRRAQEVRQLVFARRNAGMVDATLADYVAEVGQYKGSGHTNYAAFEYCKDSLVQAETMATGGERVAIAKAVSQID